MVVSSSLSFKTAWKGELSSTNDTSKTDHKLHLLLITAITNLSGFVCQAPKVLAPVVQRLDNAIHWINHYPADSVVCFVNTYPLDSDLSGG